MEQKSTRRIFDFDGYISERTTNFTGREWVFQAVNDWLANPDGSRYFLLTGEPGSGKTAIASRLVQFSHEVADPPGGLTHLTPGFLSAVHFCSAGDDRWINPSVFAESLAMQLAERYPVYAKALAEKSGDRQIRIDVQQRIEQGQAIGVVIHRFDVGGVVPEDVFNRAVREPLEELFRSGFEQPIVILVDALDEALSYSGNVNIVSLLAHIDQLPAEVRFLLTSRQDEQVEKAFLGAEELVLSSARFDHYNQGDIRQYVQVRLHADQELARVAQVGPVRSAKLVEIVPRKAEGNFLYVRFLLDAMAQGLQPLTNLEELPQGLDELYFVSLQRVVERGKRDWSKEYAPLMGVLSVAQESLTLAQVQALTQQSKSSVLEYWRQLRQFIEEVVPPEEKEHQETKYRLYHQSVSEFLHRELLSLKKRKLKNTFYLPAEEWHKHVARVCEQDDLSIIWKDVTHDVVEQGRREYARRYYLIHVHQAQQWERLFEVLDDETYGQAKLRYDPSARSYTQDLDLGRQAAAWSGWRVQEGIAQLPRLWRYTLLRCWLAHRVDRYPEEAFRLLVLLERKQEALWSAELLTDPAEKVSTLLRIAQQLQAQGSQEREWHEVLTRATELALALQGLYPSEQAKMLRALGKALAQAQQWEQAEQVIFFIEDSVERVEALGELGEALTQAQQWEQAEAVWTAAKATSFAIEDNYSRVQVLRKLGEALTKAGQWERAEAVWTAAEVESFTIDDSDRHVSACQDLGEALAQAQQWEQAERVINTIEDTFWRAGALATLGKALAQAGQWERAEAAWAAAEAASFATESGSSRAKALSKLGEALAKAEQGERAKVIWTAAEAESLAIEDDRSRIHTLWELGIALTEAGQWEWAERVSRTIEEIAVQHPSEDNTGSRTWARQDLLGSLGEAYAQAQQWEQAERVIGMMEDLSVLALSRVGALRRLANAYAQAQQWEQAERVIGTIEDGQKRLGALWKLGEAYAQAQQWERAEALLAEAQQLVSTTKITGRMTLTHLGGVMSGKVKGDPYGPIDRALCDLAKALAQARQWQQALQVIEAIDHVDLQIEVWQHLAKALAQARQWRIVKAVIPIIKGSEQQAEIWQELAAALVQEGQWKRAEAAWGQAETMIHTIEDPCSRLRALRKLSWALVQVRQWKRAEAVISTIEDGAEWRFANDERAQAWQELAAALSEAHQWKRAEGVIAKIEDSDVRSEAWQDLAWALGRVQQWKRAEAAISMMESGDYWREESTQGYWSVSEMMKGYRRALALGELGAAYAQAGQWQQAERVWTEAEAACNEVRSAYEDPDLPHADWLAANVRIEAGEALADLGKIYAQVQQWQRAERMWTAVEAVIRKIEGAGKRVKQLLELAITYVQVQQGRRAEKVLAEAEQVIHTLEESEQRAAWLSHLAEAYAQLGQWEHARRVIDTMEESNEKWWALRKWWEAHRRTRLEEWAQAQQWEQAEEWIQKIESNLLQASSLRELGKSYARAHLWEQAERVWTEAEGLIRSIKDNYWRAKAWCELGEVLAHAQQRQRAEQRWTEAELAIHTIEDSGHRSRLLSDLAEAFTRVGQWEQAERIIGMIEDDYWRASALKALGEGYIRSHLWEQAERIIGTIEHSSWDADLFSLNYWRSRLLSNLAEAYVQAQLWEQAERVVSTMEDIWREEALQNLVKALARAQLWEQAKRIISTVENRSLRFRALKGLEEAYTEAHLWEPAEQINDEIKSDSYRAILVKAYAQAHLWEQAERSVSMMEDSYERARALGELGKAYAQAHLWEQAERVWTEAERIIYRVRDREMGAAERHIEEEAAGKYWRATALGKLGKMYAQAEQWKRAERVWGTAEAVVSTIKDREKRVEASMDLATIYVQARQWERAEQTSQPIIDSGVLRSLPVRINTKLESLVMALARAQHWEWAERVIHTLGDKIYSWESAWALSKLAAEMASASVDEPLLYLIQRSWWLARTTEEACQLFSMATAFIPRYPELGLAFYEAFRQVDTFLEG